MLEASKYFSLFHFNTRTIKFGQILTV